MTKISETEWKFSSDNYGRYQSVKATPIGIIINYDSMLTWQELAEAFQIAIRSEDVLTESDFDFDEYENDTDEFEVI